MVVNRRDLSFLPRGDTHESWENKSPSWKITSAKTTKRMALVDKTNRSSPPRDLKAAKEQAKTLSTKNSATSDLAQIVGAPLKEAKSVAPEVENRVPKYRASPVERAATRRRVIEGKGRIPKGKVTKQKGVVEAKLNDEEIIKATVDPEDQVSQIPLPAAEVVKTSAKEANAPQTPPDLKDNRVLKYKVFPAERPTTRSRTSVPTVGKAKTSKQKVAKKENDVKAKIDDDEKNLEVGDEGKNFNTSTKPAVEVSLKNVDSVNPAPTNLDSDEVCETSVGGTDALETSLDLMENRVPKYRVFPVERPTTRSRTSVPTAGKTKASKEKNIKPKNVKAKVNDQRENLKSTVDPEKHTLEGIATRPCAILVERIGLDNLPQREDGSTDSVHHLKPGEEKDFPAVKISSIRKRKHVDIEKKEEAETEIPTKSHPVKTDRCVSCRSIEGTCTCHSLAETPLSSSKTGKFGKLSTSITEKKGDLPEPTPSCSKSPVVETPFRKPRTPKLSSESKKVSSTIFSCFKKPDTPRRNSTENKIFVSGLKQTPSTSSRVIKNPVYANKNMTPLRRKDSLPLELKEELYEFEVDESEPKPKKKQRRIMKIQRVRPHKKAKPKIYVPDPEMEMRLLRNLDLSPSVMEQMRAKKVEKVKFSPAHNQPSTSSHGAEMSVSASNPKPQTENTAEDKKAPSSDGGIYDVYDDDHHGDFDVDPCSSPCSKYGSSTPLQNALSKSRDSLLDDSIHRFGGLSAKVYSPVKSKPSPIPILLESYNNDPVRNGDSDRRSVLSCNSMYQHDLDISASTPVKFHKHNSTRQVTKLLRPAELNLSNCFGFDEPEIMEEPLVSPIKTTVYVPPPSAPPARAARIVKKKLLVAPPPQAAEVDVEKVINQLRSEVGENSAASASFANRSVFDDTEISPKKRSPMKRFLQRKPPATPEKVDDSLSDTEPTVAKIPRLSYGRHHLRKRVGIAEQSLLEKSTHTEPSDSEASDSDAEEQDEPAEMPFEIPAHKVVKNTKGSPKKKEAPKKKEKGMTKKDEDELEKWAKMFNSQCEQVDGFGLCVE
ncbi:hypothetical protein GE061_013940 [Apolygus lucorum]|uniref:Uncharacterized protein n=1 Tax=Apolygus lucorum TaxID=248454 RepID=A0A8S9XQF9_APOLU|nr:hypothetical protein GE061_013940 [Apolygus lucorum]